MAAVFVNLYPCPALPEREILRYAKCGGDTLPAEAKSCLNSLPPTVCGRVCWAVFDVAETDAGLDLGFTVTDSKQLKKNLSGCKKIVLFAATAGVEFDRQVLKYERVSPAKALWYQSIGAAYVESVCDTFCKELTEKYGGTRPRFSPGYGDLPLAMQKDIFTALQCEKQIGVTLNDDLFMTPTKSVTAIVGISG
jgi:hypothetical protein